MKQEILERVEKAIDKIRPHLEADGGNIEVVDLTDDFTLLFKWLGNCESCSMSSMTMSGGIEYTIKMAVPEIQKVEPVNGYYHPSKDTL